jgi:hypothetical protein
MPAGRNAIRDAVTPLVYTASQSLSIICFVFISFSESKLQRLDALCKHGVDGTAFDPTTDTLIVPDSPTGDVYRTSLNGETLTLLASVIVRPVGAGVDGQEISF